MIGDFNANAIWDNPKKDYDFSRLANRLESEFKYKSAYHDYFGEAYGKESIPTHYFWWKEDRKFHIDYCYIPNDITINKVDIGNYIDWSSLSDHRPMIVDINF